jgi:hypothetical protein
VGDGSAVLALHGAALIEQHPGQPSSASGVGDGRYWKGDVGADVNSGAGSRVGAGAGASVGAGVGEASNTLPSALLPPNQRKCVLLASETNVVLIDAVTEEVIRCVSHSTQAAVTCRNWFAYVAFIRGLRCHRIVCSDAFTIEAQRHG